MERKEFLRNFIAGGGLLISAPLIFNACSDDDTTAGNDTGGNDPQTNEISIDLNSADYAALKTTGGYAYNGNIIIIRVGESQYIALSKLCTHQGCTVSYSTNQLVCPCHGSKFDTSGSVLQGPATASLKKYTVVLNGSTLQIS
jgi:cytochrome b6-f complex iron-sulfur subunit